MNRVFLLYHNEHYPHRKYEIIDCCETKQEFSEKYGIYPSGGIYGYQFKQNVNEIFNDCETLWGDTICTQIVSYDSFFTEDYKKYLFTSKLGKPPSTIQYLERYLSREKSLNELI